ncbi:hydroxyethylthiazole kinase [Ureibacillus sp. 179-F W5.1 NHS]|uniref:Hydroxyethylthiazole kinase n=1 Tax=Lysinibacillus halotolerans TaxID=1368476 RepID=A0A3M8HG72_9BACI|nr:hydroxyethylthiazole kinase [Lysinibacillus halotolerans]RND01393.1 hydroxyethylthiazole kinase [Lysinibacillus halotolerans]
MTLSSIRKKNPLVHCITNYVVANFTANGLLATGASPVMADEMEEVEEMVSIANGLLINLGTVNVRTLESMMIAGKKANELNIPVVLDPVGVGATKYRQRAIKDILEKVNVQLIRCNMGELATIAEVEWQGRGVDSGNGDMDLPTVAKQVAIKYNCLVAVTGSKDFLTDGYLEYWTVGGHELMTQVTGTGCLLSALSAAALTLEGNPLSNLCELFMDYKRVAELASDHLLLGTFQEEIINSIHLLSRGGKQWTLS